MGALFTHELDAVTHHEWRLLPLLNLLADELAGDLFVLLHVPLFALLIALVASLHGRTRTFARIGISAFAVVHAVLHTLLSGHADYTFAGWLSHTLIYGAGLFGGLALWMDVDAWKKERNAHAGAV